MSQLKAWSYSRLSKYKTCPYAFYREVIKKDVPYVQGAEAKEGEEVHAELEYIVKGVAFEQRHLWRYPSARAMAERLRGLGASAELELGVTRDWEPCGFFDPNVWGRTKIDVFMPNYANSSAFLLDWKNGKPANKKYLDEFELQCQASILRAHYPDVKTVIGRYYFLKDNSSWAGITPEGNPRPWYNLSNVTSVREYIERVFTEINKRAPEAFRTRKNPLCNGWCAVTDCRHWKPKRDAR